ncbi:MAG: SpoIID/LytB domain-containing protein [Chitinispirillaceae bacterium]|nr:SpoIID/LytB domain-containing protein [Chitinispirillaceae bacterium]
MPTDNHHSIILPLLAAALLLPACTSPTSIRPNPPPPPRDHMPEGTAEAGVKDTGRGAHDIDFADAFDTATAAEPSGDSFRMPPTPRVENVPIASLRFSSLPVPAKTVRIALMQGVKKSVVYSVGTVSLRSRYPKKPPHYCRGRMLFEMKPGRQNVLVTAGREHFEVASPCTLLSEKEYNFLEIGDTTYRGALIIVAGKTGTFTLVNYLDVEEYLRGVVPLEMGKRPREEIEALKAQAVAARTYAYRQIVEHSAEPFDMVATTEDQVYGGVAAEYRVSDMAIHSTANLIMASGDSIIQAYYHSTCGGTTADVNEAWGKPPRTYLRSVADRDESGKAFCRNSAYFTWEEKWPWKQFSGIVLQSLQKLFPQTPFKGVVTSLLVEERFACGRVKRATITGSGWAQECGGDQIRFLLRRGTSGNPILRSSNFVVVSPDRNTISFSGRGYGHGVGMCQMGAVGRAQAGQNFITILKSYYTGVSIVIATLDGTKQRQHRDARP